MPQLFRASDGFAIDCILASFQIESIGEPGMVLSWRLRCAAIARDDALKPPEVDISGAVKKVEKLLDDSIGAPGPEGYRRT